MNPNKLKLATKSISGIENLGQNLEKLMKEKNAIKNWEEICSYISQTYDEVKGDNAGNLADYIPELAENDPEQFGVIIMSVAGQVFELGDIKNMICIQSCSKPITYGIALDDFGEEIVHNFVGREPSGRNFNELCLNHENLPHNPCINAGAIMTCSLIKEKESQSKRFEFI